jgi:polyadenylate-binding protein
MASAYDQTPPQDAVISSPQPHPYLHDPLLYISNLPPFVTDQNLAMAFINCGPFRPTIGRDGSNLPLSGTIEFKFLDKGRSTIVL